MIDLDILLEDEKIEYRVYSLKTIHENPYTVEDIIQIKDLKTPTNRMPNRYALAFLDEKDLYLSKLQDIISKAKLLLVIGIPVSNSLLAKIAKSFSGKIIAISPQADANVIYSKIKQAMMTQKHLQQELIERHYIDLVSLLSKGATIADIEKYGSKLLNNPMIITDETFAVIAYTQGFSVIDPVWEEIISNQYSPSELVDKTDVNQFWKRLDNSNIPLFVDDTAFHGCTKRAVAKMKSLSKTKGYIALLEINKRISTLDLYILQMLAEILSAKLNEKDAITKAIGQMRNDFANDVLKGNMVNQAMIVSRAKNLQILFSTWNAVLCVYVDKKDRYIGRELSDLSHILNKTCSLCLYSFDGTYGYFILSFEEKNRWKQILNSDLRKQAEQNHYIFTLSLPTDELTQISNCYLQVKAMNHALSLISSHKNQRLYSYSSMVPYHMVTRLYESIEKPFFKSRSLKTLLETDRQKETSYVNTLRTYFNNNQNVTQTASALYVHRNTVNYRLSRIRQLLSY